MNHIEKTLRDVNSELAVQINALEQSWLKLRRLKAISQHRDQSTRLEQAIDEINAVKMDVGMAWCDHYLERRDREKALEK